MMIAALLACSALAAGPTASAEADLKAYETVKAKVGRDAPSLVKLALWCEAHGLDAQRQKHLAQAVLADPTSAPARALLGLVSFRGRWMTPEKAAVAMKSDEALAARRAKYEALRDRLEDETRGGQEARRQTATAFEKVGNYAWAEHERSVARRSLAAAHARLGLWCEANGLKDEAHAHFHYSVVLDPSRESSWKHLGYVRRDGRWMTPEQAVAADKEADAQRKADRAWEPQLKKLRTGLAEPSRREEARARLDAVDDPRAVPSILRVFGDEASGELAAAMLGRIDSPASTRGLARIAVSHPSDRARAAATRALRGRDLRDYAGALVDMIQAAMKYSVQPVGGPGAPGVVVVETPRVKMIRTYDAPPAFRPGDVATSYVGYDTNGLPIVATPAEIQRMESERADRRSTDMARIEERTRSMIAQANLKAADSQQRLIADIADIEAANDRTDARNVRVTSVLKGTLDAPPDLPNDGEEAWHRWYYDKLGYRYESPAQIILMALVSPQQMPSQLAPTVSDCFAAGTPVRTTDGRKPIESLRVGDLVLSQDTATGALAFQPVLAVHHDSPDKTLRLSLDGGETIVTIGYHRFWVAGKGWAMARDLKPGDMLRTLAGRARVVSAESGEVLPVYNLDVARSRTFFVGLSDALVHDNTPPDPKEKPFDGGAP